MRHRQKAATRKFHREAAERKIPRGSELKLAGIKKLERMGIGTVEMAGWRAYTGSL